MTRSQSIRFLALATALAAVYFVAAKWGLSLARVHASASAVWPPTGIALAALLLLGYRVWAGIFLGAFLANVTTAGTVATSLGIATGNTLEGLLGAYLVNRFCNGLKAFDRAEDVFKFTLLAAMLSTTMSATFGVTSLALGGYADWSDYGAIWLTWWLGDAAGDLIVAPLLILWSENPRIQWDRWKMLEAVLLLLFVFVASHVLFGLSLRVYNRLPFPYIPILVWAAFRLGQRETATASFLAAGIAIWGTLHGVGPFVMETENESLLLLGAFMCVAAVTATALAAGVSERKQAEGQLRRYTADLESFSYSLAHDLRSPVLSISGLAGLVMKGYGDKMDPTGQEHLRRIVGHAEHMDALIKDLLAYSKLSGAPLDPQRVSLKAVLAGVLKQLAEEIRRRGARIDIQEPLPEIFVDRMTLVQILSNLLFNAVKFVAPGAAPRVRVWVEQKEQFVRISIEDNGIGIAPEHQDRIFQPFERLHNPESYPGTGIGLAIVAKGVERLGGRTGVDSELGGGSRFWIEIPTRPPASGPLPGNSSKW